jgi:hypothetical protein
MRHVVGPLLNCTCVMLFFATIMVIIALCLVA